MYSTRSTSEPADSRGSLDFDGDGVRPEGNGAVEGPGIGCLHSCSQSWPECGTGSGLEKPGSGCSWWSDSASESSAGLRPEYGSHSGASSSRGCSCGSSCILVADNLGFLGGIDLVLGLPRFVGVGVPSSSSSSVPAPLILPRVGLRGVGCRLGVGDSATLEGPSSSWGSESLTFTIRVGVGFIGVGGLARMVF